jgi:hypothetical protein
MHAAQVSATLAEFQHNSHPQNKSMNIHKLLQLDFLPRSTDAALLVLRLWLAAASDVRLREH